MSEFNSVKDQHKNMRLPSKQECFYILEMLESGVIDYRYTHPWADALITNLDTPPVWLTDIATRTPHIEQLKAIREFIFSEPCESEPVDMDKFHIGCLWLRYERRELSWASFLKEAGEFLDAVSGDWDCETPYYYLNIYENAYFTQESEESTKKEYLKNHNLKPWIEIAKTKFEPFERLRTKNI